MTCETARRELAAMLNGERTDVPRADVEGHVAGCADCRQAQQEMAAVWARLDLIEARPVPEALRTRTLRAVYREAAEEQAEGVLTLRRLGAAVGAGVLAALAYTYALEQRVGLEAVGAVRLTATAAIWSGLLVAAFCWMLGRYRQWGVHLGATSGLGAAATGLALAGALLCPGETFFALWERSSLAEALNGAFGTAAGYLVFGFVYALFPALVASIALGKRLRGRLWRNGLFAAGTFVFLLSPAAYLHCGSLAVGLFGMWTLGALAGAAGGMFGGLEIRQTWFHKVAA